jgi:asparagine synthase (glutamine-hydrolysing)
MCGIAGFAGAGTRDDLTAMTEVLAHRGPDGHGSFIDNSRVFLGHRRLSIIDLEGGRQPMANTGGTLQIVFNGEIYNHRALRRELEALGQTFQTDHSDTEVLLNGYDVWGEAVVERLDGMFAFAIYDRTRQRLFLARDRFGEKPLFYFASSDIFVFASELPSLRLHPAVAATGIDSKALQKFFAYSFLPGKITPYERVRKLLPGSTLTYDLTSGAVRERRYWRFTIASEAAPPGTEEDWAEEIARLLGRAVRSRLESDVPVGLFLSGGIDSGAIAAILGDIGASQQLSTFTIGFREKSYDESSHAAAMARLVGSTHYAALCSSEAMRDLAPEILRRLGEPLGDPSLLPTFMLSRHAARHVKVALSGDGGDELFAGYDPFKALRLASLYRAFVPRPMHRALKLVAARLPPSGANMSFDFKVNRALRGLGFGPHFWNPVWLAALEPDEIASVFGERVSIEELYSEAIEVWDTSSAPSLVDRTLEFYTNLYLPDDILVKSDRAGMMNSLEVRAPFLAAELVDFIRRLPHTVKYRAGTTKWILKRALKGRLPDEILSRRKKGFGIPISQWLRDMGEPNWRRNPVINDAPFHEWNRHHGARRRDHRGALWCRFVISHTLGGQVAQGVRSTAAPGMTLQVPRPTLT